MNITIIQHVPFEVPGLISDWARQHQHQLTIVKLFKKSTHLPSADEIDFLVVLGGPMSANNNLPWLSAERRLIKAVVEANKPMLGICLGAQQLAKAYGEAIVATPKEVGFGPVTATPTAQSLFGISDQLQVLHWHGEGFKLPKGATLLFSSRYWPFQGFKLKSAIGLQFHLESTPTTLAELAKTDAAFVPGSKYAQTAVQITSAPFQSNQLLLNRLLDYLVTANHSA